MKRRIRVFKVFLNGRWLGSVRAYSLDHAEREADKRYSQWDEIEEAGA